MTGIGHRKTPCGIDVAGQSLHDGLGSIFTAKAGHHDGLTNGSLLREIHRLAVLQHQNHRGAGLGYPKDQLTLTACQNQLGAIPPLATGDGIVAANQDRQLGILGYGNGILDHIVDIGFQ